MLSSSVVVRLFHCIRAEWPDVVLFGASTTIRYFLLAQNLYSSGSIVLAGEVRDC